MSYADKKAKREQEIAGLKEALTILSGEAFLQVRNIEDLSSMIMPALFFSQFRRFSRNRTRPCYNRHEILKFEIFTVTGYSH